MALSTEQTTTLKKQLQARQAHLQEDIRQELIRADKEHYADLAGRVHDSGDESVADLLLDIDLAVIDRQVNELRAIEAAIQRIGYGSYGVCESCNEGIKFERLVMQPAANCCVDCQSEIERADYRATPSL